MYIPLSKSLTGIAFLLTVFAMTALPVASQEATVNLLKNGNIESASATKDVPENWRTGAAVDGVTYRWANGEAGHKSPRSLCLEKLLLVTFLSPVGASPFRMTARRKSCAFKPISAQKT